MTALCACKSKCGRFFRWILLFKRAQNATHDLFGDLVADVAADGFGDAADQFFRDGQLLAAFFGAENHAAEAAHNAAFFFLFGLFRLFLRHRRQICLRV